jgi:hypothetical protein
MTRSILAGLASVVAITVLSGTGCQSTGVGDPCTPEQEYDPSYLGAQVTEVKAESKSYQCQSFLCLVNHFQGLVSCPYGQTESSAMPAQTPLAPQRCSTPLGESVTGKDSTGAFVDPNKQDTVAPNCQNRTAANSVYCSCRCANVAGQTNDGANYCTCPDGFDCKQLISSIGVSFEGLTGAYCIKHQTDFDPAFICNPCDSSTASCGAAQGVAAK